MKAKQMISALMASCLVIALLASCGESSQNTSSGASTGSGATVDAGSTGTGSTDDIFELESDVFGTESEEATSAVSSVASKPQTTSSAPAKQVFENSEEFKKLPKYEQEVYKMLPDNVKLDSEKKLTFMNYEGGEPNATLLGHKYGIQLEIVDVPFGERATRLISSINAGKGPDITTGQYSYGYISKGYLLDWTPYLNVDKKTGWEAEAKIASIFKYEGKNYVMFPTNLDNGTKWAYIAYNKSVFEDAGLTTPDELYKQNKWDWTALTDLADKLTDRDAGIAGFYDYRGPLPFIHSSGNDYINFVNGRAKNMVNSAVITRATNAYIQMANNDSLSYASSPETGVKRGQIAMATVNDESFDVLASEINKGEVGVVPFPKDPEASNYIQAYTATGYYLCKDAKHPNNAAAAMEVFHAESQPKVVDLKNQYLVESKQTELSYAFLKQLQEFDTKTTGVVATWSLFANTSGYAASIAAALSNGQTWSQIAAEMSPQTDADILAFYGE